VAVADSVNFDRMAGRYDATRGGTARGTILATNLGPYLPKGRLLEIGVGTGLIAAAFAELGYDVVGVDLSAKMLALAAQRVPGRLAQADAARLPIASGSVDACLAVHVMHLVGDAPAVVAEVARVLRPGGRFAVTGAAGRGDESDIARVVAEMDARLDGGALRERAEQLRALPATAERAGLRLAEEFWVAQGAGEATPAQVITGIEGRLWSRLWDLPAQTWNEAVEPTLEALRALPGQDVSRTAQLSSPVRIFEVPAA
jgi:SAM-dependent methyltransferase